MRSLTALSVPRRLRVALIAAFIATLIAPTVIFAQSSSETPEKKAPRGKMTFEHSLAFDRVQLGTSKTLSVTLSDATAVAIAITKISIAGTGYAITSNNCPATLAASGGSCVVSVTFTPTKGKNAKGVKVDGTLTIKDNASNSPQDVALSATEFGPAAAATPTPTPTAVGAATPTPGSGTPFAIQAAGIYVFNTAKGVASPQIIQYSTNTSSGATTQSTMAAAGTGLLSLTFTADGKHCYGVDSAGNVWGYSVGSGGALTSLGSPTAPPTGAAAPTFLQTYDSSVLWAAPEDVTGATSVVVQQYPISGGGTLGTPTAVTLSGNTITPFPEGSNHPAAVWALSAFSPGSLFTLNVYPVSGSGMINGTSSQTISVPQLFQAMTGGFAYGVGETSGAQTLYTFGLSSNGMLTANPSASLPTATGWEPAGAVIPEIGPTLNVVDSLFDFLVYPVNSSGVLGTNFPSTMLSGSPEFPYSATFNTSSGTATYSELPILWVHAPGSTTVNEFAINSNGTIGASSGSVTTGSGVELLEPEKSPFSYGIDVTSGIVYEYQVSSGGVLTSTGSFTPAVPGGQSLFPDAFTFGTTPSSNPVALFVYAFGESSGQLTGTILVYPLASNGTAGATALDTISTSGVSESYVVYQNGQVQLLAFGGG